VLNALDAAGIRIGVALWAHLDEYEDWRLIVCGRQLDAIGIWEGYGQIRKATDKAGIPAEKIGRLMIMKMKDPFIRELRRLFAKTSSVEGMRLGGQLIGDRYVEDAYVYRIS
jgi:hypothetical protein